MDWLNWPIERRAIPDRSALSDLTVRAVRAVPVEAPLNFVLGISQGAFSRALLLLIDLDNDRPLS